MPKPEPKPKKTLTRKQRRRLGQYLHMARKWNRRHKWWRARYYAKKILQLDPDHRLALRIKKRAEGRLGL
jgi:hypothetical protein